MLRHRKPKPTPTKRGLVVGTRINGNVSVTADVNTQEQRDLVSKIRKTLEKAKGQK